MPIGTDTAGNQVKARRVRVVAGLLTTDETGRAVSVQPIRYVDAAAAADELGRPVDALQVEVVTDILTADASGVEAAMPVRVVGGTVTTNEAGQAVPVLPVFDVVEAGTLDETITPPVLSISEAQDEYPFDVDYLLEGAIPDDGTYSLVFQSGDTYAGMLAASLSSYPLDGSAIDAGFNDIISPAETYIRARLATATTYSNWSNIISHGDAVAPSITSTDTASVAEMATLAKTIETDKLCYFAITGGADQAEFELSGSEPADTITLRFVGDGTVNREVDGTSLAVTVTATALNGLTDAQPITVTITDVDEVASALGFTDVASATPSTQYDSNEITLAGLASGYSAPIEATGTGFYKLNGGAWTALPLSTTGANGTTLQLRLTSDADYLDAVSIVVTVGDADNEVTDTWTVTNSAAPSDVIITPSSSGIPATIDPPTTTAATFTAINFGAGKHVVVARYHYATNDLTCTIGGNSATIIAQSGVSTSGRTTVIFQYNGGSSGNHDVVIDSTQTLSEVSVECFTVTNAADAVNDSAVREYGTNPLTASSALDVAVGGGGLAAFTWGSSGAVSSISANLTQLSYAALTTMSRQTSSVTPNTNVAPSLSNAGGSSGTVAAVSWNKI